MCILCQHGENYMDDSTTLDCSRCTSLTTIPRLDNLTRLDCSGCPSLTSISRLDNLTRLYCYECTSLTTIPRLDNLIRLDCSGCTSLTSIPHLNNVIRLDCYGCTSLTTIPEMDNLKYLFCSGCTFLTYVPEEFILGSVITGCKCLEETVDYDSSVLPKIITIQLWWQKVFLWKKINNLVYSEKFLEIYYKPGNKGEWVSKKQLKHILKDIPE